MTSKPYQSTERQVTTKPQAQLLDHSAISSVHVRLVPPRSVPFHLLGTVDLPDVRAVGCRCGRFQVCASEKSLILITK
jgi:hypothetical protein